MSSDGRADRGVVGWLCHCRVRAVAIYAIIEVAQAEMLTFFLLKSVARR